MTAQSLAAAPLRQTPPDADRPREPLFEGLGAHRRVVTTSSPEAQRYFDQGLAFLFAFNHDEAIRSFAQAADIDPTCAMAWWGLAMANGPHINFPMMSPERTEAAWRAIERARAAAGPATDVERALIDAAHRRYAQVHADDRKSLDEAYARAMEAVWKAHPNDPDVGALAAEALMDLRPWALWTAAGEPEPDTQNIVAMLESVMKLRPDHPLACHLYIHAVEASPHPERALAAADRLRRLQPGLPHMVHMPSHIDVRLGHWREAVEANELAVDSDRAYRVLRPGQGFYRLYMLHDHHMLAYAAMMRGQSARAIQAMDTLIAEMPIGWARENAPIADGYFAMPIEVRLRFGRWDDVLSIPEPESVFPISRALRHAARATALAALGRLDDAQDARRQFQEARSAVPADAQFGHSPASLVLAVAENFMEGEVLLQAGKLAESVEYLRKAVEAEDALGFDEPPDWILPARHALGAVLLASGRAEEAEAVYREDLRRLPENGWSLFGLSRALEYQAKQADAADALARWQAVWKDADVDLSSSCFCVPGGALVVAP